ncbi:MAG: hypothetical protein LBH43_04375 [Treponema sp.]|nr:hypothetical protein [Treponema sp.]
MADYRRLGKTAFANKHQPYMDQNIWQYKSLDIVVSDHHCLDCVAVYQGKLVRPWVTTMQDYRSGKILGWCLSAAPSSLSIIVAYYMAVIRYGIPRRLLSDNGKDYRSELLNGKTAAAKAYTPQRFGEEEEVYIQGLFYRWGAKCPLPCLTTGNPKAARSGTSGVSKSIFPRTSGASSEGTPASGPKIRNCISVLSTAWRSGTTSLNGKTPSTA